MRCLSNGAVCFGPGELPELGKLDLSVNRIEAISASFASVQTLKDLSLFNNKLMDFNVSLLKRPGCSSGRTG